MSNVNEVRTTEPLEQVPKKKIQLKKGGNFKILPPSLVSPKNENPETVSQLKKDTSLFSPIVGKFNGKKVFLQGIMNKQLPTNCDFVSPVTSPTVQAAIKAVQKLKQKPQVSFNEQQPVLINRKEHATNDNDSEPKKGNDENLPLIKGILKGVPTKKMKVKLRKPKLVRPSTPEQVMLNCLDCPDMQDFIKGLQGEVKRLQDLSNELNMQIIMEGSKVKEQVKQEEQQVQVPKTVCPQCPTTQLRKQAKKQQESQIYNNNTDLLDQRPTAPRVPEILNDLVIKRGSTVEPYTGKAASRIRDLHEMRKVAEYEKEQINFVDQMKLATEQKQISLALGPKAQFARLGTPSRITPRNATVLKSLNQQSQQN